MSNDEVLKQAHEAIENEKREKQAKEELRDQRGREIAEQLAFAEWSMIANELELKEFVVSDAIMGSINGLEFTVDGHTVNLVLCIDSFEVKNPRLGTDDTKSVVAFWAPTFRHQYFAVSAVVNDKRHALTMSYRRDETRQNQAELYRAIQDCIDLANEPDDDEGETELYSDYLPDSGMDDLRAQVDAWKAKAQEQSAMVKAIMTALEMPEHPNMDNVEWASLVRKRADAPQAQAEPAPAVAPMPKRIQVKIIANPTASEFEEYLNDGWSVAYETRHALRVKSGVDVAEHFVRFERESSFEIDDEPMVVANIANHPVAVDELVYTPREQVVIVEGSLIQPVYNTIPEEDRKRPLVDLIIQYGAEAVKQSAVQEVLQTGKNAFSKAKGQFPHGNQ